MVVQYPFAFDHSVSVYLLPWSSYGVMFFEGLLLGGVWWGGGDIGS